MNFETVWDNIKKYEGETFKTKTGIEYKYVVYDGYILINDNKTRKVKKFAFEKALKVENPTPSKINNEVKRAGAYVYGIIIDERIIT